MTTYPFIEDYIEIMAGIRSLQKGSTQPGWINIFGASKPVISLARYDTNIVSSMAQQTVNGTGYSDKQSELALKLVAKYQRQFATLGVDVAPSVQNPKFRIPVRIIDRARKLYASGQQLILKFPYDNKMVPLVSQAAKESKGKFHFNREQKFWEIALTEYNINWAYTFAKEHEFEIDPTIDSMMKLILECEKVDYKIELYFDNGFLAISNAETSLISYINEHLGGFGSENLCTLVDYASVLGYTVHSDIIQALQQGFDLTTIGIILNRESHIARVDPNDSPKDFIKKILDYAAITNRWPVCFYEPDMSFRLRDDLFALIKSEEILDMSKKKSNTDVDLDGVKCVYFTKLKRNWNHPVPILISTNAMLYGAEKQAMLLTADKVVYYTPTTLHLGTKTIAG